MSLRKFEIKEMIAKGGMAEVYRAETMGPEGFAKEVCVKKILPHLTEDKNFVQMFLNEAKLAATLNYSNIVEVHDLCVSADKEYFIVMEYVDGKDLSDVIRAAQLAGKEIPPGIAVYVCRETCKGLYYAHTRTDKDGAPLNIIHRDISPQNVLASFMGEVKIADFGIAKASSSVNKTAAGILKGKYGYMSPEQARGERLDHRSDIFCLGIVLYEVLVGERCFAGASDYSTLNLMREAVVTPPTKINARISPDLEAIVLKALSKDPKNRYSDALEFEGALAAFARKLGIEMGASDLARFMRDLFPHKQSGAENEPGGSGPNTGTLSLASVVGPAPEKKEQPGEAAARSLREKKQKSDLIFDPTFEVRQRRKKVPGLESPDGPKTAPLPIIDPPPEALAAAGSMAPEKRSSMPPPPPAPGTGDPKADAITPVAGARALAAKKAEAGKKADAPAERKPARAAPEKPAGLKPAADKKPVGRAQLRPGLTAMLKTERGKRMPVLSAFLVLSVAGGVGTVLGNLSQRAMAQEDTFRSSEVEGAIATPAVGAVQITIESEPPGATVWLDDAKLAEKTPLTLERPRDDAQHNLELKLAGHEPKKATLSLSAEGSLLSEHVLEPEKAKLSVESEPPGASVQLDAQLVGQTPLTIEAPIGPHLLTLSGSAFEPREEEILVEPKGPNRIRLELAPKGGRAELSIASPGDATIWVDGRSTGQVTNGDPLGLAPGVSHRITLVNEARRIRKELRVELKEGEKRRLFVDLDEAS